MEFRSNKLLQQIILLFTIFHLRIIVVLFNHTLIPIILIKLFEAFSI